MKSDPVKTGIELFSPKGTMREAVKQFGMLFVVLFAIVVTFFSFFTYTGFQKFTSLREREEVEHLKLMRFSLVSDLQVLRSDLLVIANSEALNQFVNSGSATHLASLENRLAVFAGDRKIYDQIRYIDILGEEVVRVNYRGDKVVVVPRQQLQNKKERYYFQQTMALGSGEIFLSNLDLNVEGGELERPLNPTLRVALPVFDVARKKTGMVILNYKAKRMLDRFAGTHPIESSTEYSLLNQDGYWLNTQDSRKEWGALLGHGSSFAKQYPDAWQQISSQDSNRIFTSQGLYLIQKISPLNELTANSWAETRQQGNNEEWIIAAHISGDELSYLTYMSRHVVLLYALTGVLFLLGIGAWQVSIIRVAKNNAENSIRLLSRGMMQSPAAVLITDKEGKITYANPKFEQMSGYSVEEVIGQNPRIFKSGTTSKSVYKDLWQTIKQGKIWEGSFENRDKQGRHYHVAAQISPITNGKGHVENFIAIQEDVTEKIETQRKLEKLATIDSLTGACNRGHFMYLCAQEGRRLARYKRPISMLVFDLDHFKNINDTYGHQGGDLVLIECVKHIQSRLRESDIFGRLGGEEFGALLVETNLQGAVKLAERLRLAIEKLPVQYDGRKIRVTVSIGCSEWSSNEVGINEVLKKADQALYVAKNNGRNRVESC